ncbi:MAG: glycosyltransferase [Elusimicrobia bacterium]|nr:glycosyltransferase [Elusimicrobiota bacterium]
MQISGATIIRNGVKLGYPFAESIKSILPICSEFIVCVGNSDDGTREKVEAINDKKIKIIDTTWDEKKRLGGEILSEQTNIALSKCFGDWIFYIQSDEVVNEKDYDKIVSAIEKAETKNFVDGIIFNYLHFYGSYSTIQTGRNWYKQEVRLVRNFRGIVSHGDAQGFRKERRKLCVIESGARIYHYCWARPPEVMAKKIKDFHKLWHEDKWLNNNCLDKDVCDYFSDLGNLKNFIGEHPYVMKEFIKNDSSAFIEQCRKRYLSERNFIKAIKDFMRSYPFGIEFGRHKNFRLIKL